MFKDKKTASEYGKKSSRKGIPNKDTVLKKNILAAFEELIEDEEFVEKFKAEIKGLSGKDFILTLDKLLEYVKPKLARTENVNVNLFSDVEVDLPKELLEKLDLKPKKKKKKKNGKDKK